MILISPITQMVARNGVALFMQAGVEQFVRESLVKLAIAQGCQEVGAVAQTAEPEDPKPLQSDAVLEAVQLLVEEGDPKNFSQEGLPKVKAIENLIGYDINAADRDVAWAQFQQE